MSFVGNGNRFFDKEMSLDIIVGNGRLCKCYHAVAALENNTPTILNLFSPAIALKTCNISAKQILLRHLKLSAFFWHLGLIGLEANLSLYVLQ